MTKMERLDLSCDSCGAAINGEDIELSLGLASCSSCGTVFSITDLPPALPSSAPSNLKGDLPQPKGVQLAHNADELQITIKWFALQYVALVFFCVLWDGFLVMWYSIGLNQLANGDGSAVMTLLFPLLHVATGVGLTYYTLAGFLNTTTVVARPDSLSITHAPLPWPGNRELSSAEIVQLWVERYERRNKNSVTVRFRLNAILNDHSQVTLLNGLQTAQEGWFLEHQLESHLGITDTHVKGETR